MLSNLRDSKDDEWRGHSWENENDPNRNSFFKRSFFLRPNLNGHCSHLKLEILFKFGLVLSKQVRKIYLMASRDDVFAIQIALRIDGKIIFSSVKHNDCRLFHLNCVWDFKEQCQLNYFTVYRTSLKCCRCVDSFLALNLKKMLFFSCISTCNWCLNVPISKSKTPPSWHFDKFMVVSMR